MILLPIGLGVGAIVFWGTGYVTLTVLEKVLTKVTKGD